MFLWSSAALGADNQRTVKFVSPDGEVSLSVGGAEAVVIPKGGTKSFAVQGDEVRYSVSSGENWQYSATVDLQRVKRRTITLSIPGMHVRVVNRSDEPREIIAGNRRLGILKRGQARTFGPIWQGITYIKSIGARSRTHIASPFDNRPGAFETVVLNTLAPGLVVRNPIEVRVQVRVDNRNYGVLEGGGEVIILGLSPGQHQVELIDSRTGRPFRFDAVVKEKELEQQIAAAISLRVSNATGETLIVPAALGGIFERPIEPGENVVMTVPRKRFKLKVTGKASGLIYDLDIDPRMPDVTRWNIERPRGRLHLRNGTGEIATVQIDSFGALNLPIGAKIQVANVPAGKLRLAVKTKASKREFVRGISLNPGSDVQWTVSTGRSSLMIKNRWAEPVDLAIDGSPRGRVGPESTFRVAKITPGTHELVAQTIVSKVREVVAFVVVDGQQTDVHLDPPAASVRLNNRSKEALAVIVRGAEAGVVQPSKHGTFAVVSGRMAVEVRGNESRNSVTWIGTLAPAQQIILPNPTRGAAPVLVENPYDSPISVRIDAREPVEVQPGKRKLLSDLSSGAHTVEISGKSFVMRQRVHVAKGLPRVRIQLPEMKR